ncbi:MAG: hypothetical protein HY706_19500 [Candidatus Hydrogenedentes bacterium]|nr:hypothetical protein [Candidatus Hydrogenedentota bacterium]
MSSLSLLNLIAASFAAGTSSVNHNLDTANGFVEFTVGERGAFISRWEIDEEGHRRSWVASEPLVPLWTVTVQQTSGDRASVTALDGPGSVREASAANLTVAWTALMPGKVDVTMTVTVRGADLVWGLEASVKAQNCALWDITFPEIGSIARPEEVHSITTAGWGLIHDDLMHRPLNEGTYPSSQCSMPFAAVSDGETGVYVGSEDAEGYPLRLFAGRAKGQPVVTLGMRHDIPDMGIAKSYRIPYSVATTAYVGDWYEAARQYRRAVQSAPWGRVPPLAERNDIPKWLINTDLWYIGSCDDEPTAKAVLDFAKYFEVPVSAHVYTWHQIPFDDHYPEYFPAKQGFRDAVSKVQKAGVAVMPYINGRLWDAATKSWAESGAKDAAATNLNGDHYEEVYGSKVPLTPMCPTTELWQETVTQLVDRLVNEVGVRGVYIDQISAAAPRRCFAENHGHPRGGGSYWIQGYRDLLDRCRAVLPPRTALTTEENADPWNDLLDAFLMVNTQPRGGTIVPLYPAVYGGRVVSFGFQYFSGTDYEARYPLRLKFAQEFTFGSQLGWIGPSILQKGNEVEAEFLKRLCRARHAARDALQFGELLAPVIVESAGSVSWTEKIDGTDQTRTAAAVLAGAWLTPSGKRKLAVVNIADQEETLTLRLDSRHVGYVESPRLLLKTRGNKTAAILSREAPGIYRGKLSVPSRNAVVFDLVSGRGA